MLDDRVREVLARLEAEDAEGSPDELRCYAVGPDAGRLLFSLVTPNPGCQVLEIGASHGYSTIWLAAAARILGGNVVSLESDPARAEVWRRNVAEAGLEEHAELVEGNALETLPGLDEGFDLVFLDAWKRDYEALFGLARAKVDPGGVIVADNVVSHGEDLAAYVAARQSDPGLVSVTVPVGNGLEVTTVIAPSTETGDSHLLGSWSRSRRTQVTVTSLPFPSAASTVRVGVPRKGGGPVVTDSCSTGSGGTSG